MNIGLARRHRRARVDDNEPRRIRALQTVKDPHPQDGLRLGDVVADQEERVALVKVDVRARLPVRAKCFLERIISRRSAQTRVAVEVIRADPAARDHTERVVVLQKELPCRVETECRGAGLGQQVLRARGHDLERLLPRRLVKVAVAAHERTREPLG